MNKTKDLRQNDLTKPEQNLILLIRTLVSCKLEITLQGFPKIAKTVYPDLLLRKEPHQGLLSEAETNLILNARAIQHGKLVVLVTNGVPSTPIEGETKITWLLDGQQFDIH